MSVAAAIFSLVVYILMSISHLARTYFVSGQLSHALQGALVVSATLEDDLRQATRDPRDNVAIVTGADPNPSISFYRGAYVTLDGRVALVPVRWVMKTEGEQGYLVRTAWDHDRGAWDTTSYRWAPVPLAGTDGKGMGFRIAGDGDNDVLTILVAVLARAKKLEMAGAGQDRATVQISVSIPPLPDLPQPLFYIFKKIEELPAP
jgi:hypothetical protein